jgi:hypothetical protein
MSSTTHGINNIKLGLCAQVRTEHGESHKIITFIIIIIIIISSLSDDMSKASSETTPIFSASEMFLLQILTDCTNP